MAGARSPGGQGDGKAKGGQGLAEEEASAAQRRRLKQLHWDKLKQAREGTVWSKGSGKLHINFAELESLFQVGGWVDERGRVGGGSQGIGWVGWQERAGAPGWAGSWVRVGRREGCWVRWQSLQGLSFGYAAALLPGWLPLLSTDRCLPSTHPYPTHRSWRTTP